jgi:nucleoside-diphosphate-sugar epimerase
MRRAVITGATGFIGSYLIEELIKRDIEIIAVVRPDSAHKNRLIMSDHVTVVECDMDNIEKLEKLVKKDDYDVFYDLAWDGVAGNARADYKLQLKNVEHSIDALQVACRIGCRRFIGASSVSEYECTRYMPLDEVKVGGRFIYSTAKLTSHYMNKCLAQRWGIEYISANIANTFGERGNDALIIHDTIIKMLAGKPTAFTDGTQMYDFLYVADVAVGLCDLGESGHAFCSYYIGSDKPRPLCEYLVSIRDYISPSLDIGLGKRVSDGMSLPVEVFDNSKFKEHTGFCQKFSFEEGLQKTIEWYKWYLGID